MTTRSQHQIDTETAEIVRQEEASRAAEAAQERQDAVKQAIENNESAWEIRRLAGGYPLEQD